MLRNTKENIKMDGLSMVLYWNPVLPDHKQAYWQLHCEIQYKGAVSVDGEVLKQWGGGGSPVMLVP
jgi:hypothetical protein